MKTKTFFLLIFCLITSLNASAQAKEITQDEFYAQFHSAINKPFDSSKRKTTTETSYDDNGKVDSETKIVEEFLNPDKRRYVKTDKSLKSASKVEVIQIGETYYCRNDNKQWKQSNSCMNQGFKVLPNALISKITVDDARFEGKTAKVYRQFITYKNDYPNSKDKETIHYFDNKFWVGDDGTLLGEETETGVLGTRKVDYAEKTVYEYNLKNIKIEAPIIKGGKPAKKQ